MSDEPELTIVRAGPERWEAVVELLGTSGAVGCWCQAWRGFDTAALSGGLDRMGLLRQQMEGRPPAPGYLAYLGEKAVGWVGVGVRTETPRLARSKLIPLVDDEPVWSIGCFRVRPGHRRRGVARALLAGVIDAARQAGAPGIEAYPIDPEGRRMEVGAAYVGLASTFDTAGFRRVLVTEARSGKLPRHLVRLDLGSPSPPSP